MKKLIRPTIETAGFVAVLTLIACFANIVQDPLSGAIAQILFLLWYLYCLKAI